MLHLESDREGSHVWSVERGLVGGEEVISEGKEAVLEAEGPSDGSNAVSEGVAINSKPSRGLVNVKPRPFFSPFIRSKGNRIELIVLNDEIGRVLYLHSDPTSAPCDVGKGVVGHEARRRSSKRIRSEVHDPSHCGVRELVSSQGDECVSLNLKNNGSGGIDGGEGVVGNSVAAFS